MNHVSCLQKVCCIFLLIVKIHNAHYKSVISNFKVANTPSVEK